MQHLDAGSVVLKQQFRKASRALADRGSMLFRLVRVVVVGLRWMEAVVALGCCF